MLKRFKYRKHPSKSVNLYTFCKNKIIKIKNIFSEKKFQKCKPLHFFN